MKTCDFSGWATRNDIKCSDGRTIRENAFIEDDGKVVPLVWNHQHNEPENVLGHALLKNTKGGVRVDGFFNDTDSGRNAKMLVDNGDVVSLSIYANQLKQNGGDVLHGQIREVSLVLAGANPGAYIDTIVAHSDNSDEEAIIYSDCDLFHSDKEEEEIEEDEEKKEEIEEPEVEVEEDAEEEKKKKKKKNDDEEEDEELSHADAKEEKMAEEKTVKDVFDSMSEEQKNVVYFMIGQALEDAGVKNNEGEEQEEMKHNLFDNDDNRLMHAEDIDFSAVFNDAKRFGTLKESFLQHADELEQTYGITNIDWLFPEERLMDTPPGFIKRTPDAWVDVVMNGVHHTPFSRIKMMFADLREDDARAKGYAKKGKLKKEEVFGLLKRAVTPTTVYKKQKLDRDDIVDITDFDVVAWLKGEMRMMLDEELARAYIFSDGRSDLSEDKISEANIIPICKDEDFYAIKKAVTPGEGETFEHAFIRCALEGQDDYEGSGNTTLFVAQPTITKMLLMEDGFGHRLYKDVNELALAMSVSKIVKVPATIIPEGIYGVIVDLKDYNVGADKGGAVNMFDDFDIDYNQQKYLIETRCSGALTKPFSAIVLNENGSEESSN